MDLRYSVDGGETYPYRIASEIDSKTDSYLWDVVDIRESDMRVKIASVEDPTIEDTSDADFAIKPALRIVSPNGAEIATVDTIYPITWAVDGKVEDVSLKLSTDGGVTYPYTIVESMKCRKFTYGWHVPDTVSYMCKVKISDVSDAQVFDESDASFKIRPDITLVVPNGQEAFKVGSINEIIWTTKGNAGAVKLEYSTEPADNFPHLIASDVDSQDFKYSWQIPDTLSSTCRVKVTSLTDPTVYDTSDADFAIEGALEVIRPAAGQVLRVGTTAEISWARTGSIGTVKIDYSADGGKTFPYRIVSGIDADRLTYVWRVPDAISDRIKIKITSCQLGTF